MEIRNHKYYLEDVLQVSQSSVPWEKLKDATLVITGATGMIGTFLVDVIMHKNLDVGLNCNLYLLGRSMAKLEERFFLYSNVDNIHLLEYDVNGREPLEIDVQKVKYLLHLASNTHPLAYSTDPIGTITANIVGIQNVLDFASNHKDSRTVFTSSVEIYGENRGDTHSFTEEYCGYIDCNTLRAGYPESKRAAEALCQAYIAQKGLDIVIARLARTYGPTLLKTDSKALTQFLRNGVERKNIILKSEGKQFYSYSYVADTVSGILYTMFFGNTGEAYNIADTDVTLLELAELISKEAGTKIEFMLPDAIESAGYSKATMALLDTKKIHTLGWHPKYDINTGVYRTLHILRECQW